MKHRDHAIPVPLGAVLCRVSLLFYASLSPWRRGGSQRTVWSSMSRPRSPKIYITEETRQKIIDAQWMYGSKGPTGLDVVWPQYGEPMIVSHRKDYANVPKRSLPSTPPVRVRK